MNHPLASLKLKPGDQVSVAGWPARDGSKRLGGHKLVLSDGREIMLRPAINLPVRREYLAALTHHCQQVIDDRRPTPM